VLNVTATGNITFAGPGTISDAGQGLTAASFSSTSGNIVIGGNGTAANVLGNISGAIGINASQANGGAITVAGTGNVTGTAGAAIALDAGLGGRTITVGGTAANTSVGNVLGATDGITATELGGGITIENVGTVTGSAGNGIDASFQSGGGGIITIAGTAAINGGVTGINASFGGGGGTITVGGTAAADQITSVTGGANGIAISSGSVGVLIAGIGSVTGGNGSGQFGIDATLTASTGVVIGANGVSAAGLVGNVSGGTGINVSLANTGGGPITVAGVGNVTGAAGAGIALDAGSGGTITVGGTAADTSIGNVLGATDGITATMLGGDITIEGVGNVTALSGTGIEATPTTGGNITIENIGDVAASGLGINAATGAGIVTIQGIGNVQGATDGITALASGGGAISIEGVGNVSGASGNGIAANFGVGGTITITGIGAVSGGVTGIDAGGFSGTITVGGTTATDRITSVTGGGTGINVSTTSAAGVLIAGIGGVAGGNAAGQFGIDVTLSGSTGVVIGANGVSAAGLIGNVSGGTGINVSLANTGGGGSITVAGVGSVTGAAGPGIALDAGIGGTITVGGTAANTSIGNVQGATDGITATMLGGDITIEGVGNVTALSGTGIEATPTTGGNITIENIGDVAASGLGINAATGAGIVTIQGIGNVIGSTGIVASAASGGTVSVTTTHNVTGLAASGISASAPGGVTITIDGGVSQGATNAIAATSITSIQVTNNATIMNLSGLASDQAVSTSTSGTGTIVNAGLMIGTVAMAGSGAQTLTDDGIWTTLGTSTFSPNSTVDNGGSIVVSEVATFSGLASLSNSGAIVLTSTSGQLATSGNLGFAPGSVLGIQVSPTSAGKMTAGGTATLAGTVQANFAPGDYAPRSYVILTAGGVSGTFDSLMTSGLVGFKTSLDYTTPDTVMLDLSPGSLALTGLNRNQTNVANAINGVFNTSGNLPPGFLSLFGLSGAGLDDALTQLSGEAATDAGKGAFQLMTDLLNLMLDPTAGNGGGGDAGGVSGFADGEPSSLPPDIALAYAQALRKQAPPQPAGFNQRWSAWASGYGGYNTTDGNATTGSNNVTVGAYGFAAGMTYHVTPTTDYGFTLAGGGTNWDLTQNLGGGRSDSFQAGVYNTTHFGAAYLSGALAFANHWFTTNRIAVGDQLTAKFEGQSYAARVEAGYRYAVLPMAGVTPYAALQVQDFHTPAYSETDLSGGGFGLSYNAVNATDTRSELGVQFDDLTTLDGMPLVLRGRLGWAHDWVSNQSIGAIFQALPGSNFIVNGAATPANSALATAAGELHLSANWTAIAKFYGEFASTSQTYAGTGTLKYSW
jgi:uncharacterized protein with beta-barrel porin domain